MILKTCHVRVEISGGSFELPSCSYQGSSVLSIKTKDARIVALPLIYSMAMGYLLTWTMCGITRISGTYG